MQRTQNYEKVFSGDHDCYGNNSASGYNICSYRLPSFRPAGIKQRQPTVSLYHYRRLQNHPLYLQPKCDAFEDDQQDCTSSELSQANQEVCTFIFYHPT